MERRIFLQKLARSLLVIGGVAAVGILLPDRNSTSGATCDSGNACDGCNQSAHCGLPQHKAYHQKKQQP